MEDVQLHIEEEAFIVRNSGEIPEVAYHGSIYYLTSDPEGPQLDIDDREFMTLKKMVVERYYEIIQRDLTPENRHKSIYRGLARSYANWCRLKKFCERELFDLQDMKREVAEMVVFFLENEARECLASKGEPCINIQAAELLDFTKDLGIAKVQLPKNLPQLCPANNEEAQ